MHQLIRVFQHGKVAGIGYEADVQLAQLLIVQIQVAQQKGTVSIPTVAVNAMNLAGYAFSHVVDQVFSSNLTTKAYADPRPDNKKASKLCTNLGFVSKPRPAFLEKGPTYLEVTRDTFKSACPAESV